MERLKSVILKPIKDKLTASYYKVGNLSVTRRIIRLFAGNIEIFCYHRVLTDEVRQEDLSPNRVLAVSMQRFEE